MIRLCEVMYFLAKFLFFCLYKKVHYFRSLNANCNTFYRLDVSDKAMADFSTYFSYFKQKK